MSTPILAGRSFYNLIAEFLIFFFGLGIFIVPSSIPFSWWIIPSVSFLLFLIEYRNGCRDNLRIALFIGIFLTVFDFIFENVGTWLGFWGCHASSFLVLAVPLEVMLTCFFGGAAWFMYMLSVNAEAAVKFEKRFSRSIVIPLILLDLFFFGIGGSTAEWCLIQRGYMYYSNGWTAFHAFLAYFSVWSILHIITYLLKPRFLHSACPTC